MIERKLNWIGGCAFVAMAVILQPARTFGEPTTEPTTQPAAGAKDTGGSATGDGKQGDDTTNSEWTADDFRVSADALWGVKHDYAKALETYHKGINRFPKSVRILVSLSANSIDFAYQHPDSKAGRSAYQEARSAITKGLGLIKDGTGEDIDESAQKSLTMMLQQIPEN